MQMAVPALVMLVPNRPMQLLLPGGQPSLMLPQPHLTTLTPGPPPITSSGHSEGPKSGNLQSGFNPWNLGLDELHALVNQFRFPGFPAPDAATGQPAGGPPTGAPINPAGNPNVPPNGQQPPPQPGPAVAAPNPLAPNEVKTDESSRVKEGDNLSGVPEPTPQNATDGTSGAAGTGSGDANRRRNVMHNPIEQQHNTIETRFAQSPGKMNTAAVCEAAAAAKAPTCVADHKWEEIMRQEIDCGLQRKREWRCYCGFFEGEDKQSQS